MDTHSTWKSGLLLDHSEFKWNNTRDTRLDSGMWPIGSRYRHPMKASYILNHPPKPYLAPWLHIAFQPMALSAWFSSKILLCSLLLSCQYNLYSHKSHLTSSLSATDFGPHIIPVRCTWHAWYFVFTDGETRALRGKGLTKNHPADWC